MAHYRATIIVGPPAFAANIEQPRSYFVLLPPARAAMCASDLSSTSRLSTDGIGASRAKVVHRRGRQGGNDTGATNLARTKAAMMLPLPTPVTENT